MTRKKNRFDHHQEGGAGNWENGVPYSSFGLVWKKFGLEITKDAEIYEGITKKLVLPIDSMDNGIDIYELKGEVEPYTIDNVRRTFLPYGEELKDADAYDKRFLEAVNFARRVLEREIFRATAKKTDEQIVAEIYKNSAEKRYVVLEREMSITKLSEDNPGILFVVSPRFGSSNWGIRKIEKNRGSFEARKLFPESWAGKSGEEFEKVTGVKGAKFCHNGRWIAVAGSKDAALQLVEIALNS